MYCPIVGTLGYILSPDRRKTLLIHRNLRSDDHHLDKYNGLGGKMLPDEDVVSCLRREIFEEAGIQCEEIVLREQSIGLDSDRGVKIGLVSFSGLIGSAAPRLLPTKRDH